MEILFVEIYDKYTNQLITSCPQYEVISFPMLMTYTWNDVICKNHVPFYADKEDYKFVIRD